MPRWFRSNEPAPGGCSQGQSEGAYAFGRSSYWSPSIHHIDPWIVEADLPCATNPGRERQPRDARRSLWAESIVPGIHSMPAGSLAQGPVVLVALGVALEATAGARSTISMTSAAPRRLCANTYSVSSRAPCPPGTPLGSAVALRNEHRHHAGEPAATNASWPDDRRSFRQLAHFGRPAPGSPSTQTRRRPTSGSQNPRHAAKGTAGVLFQDSSTT